MGAKIKFIGSQAKSIYHYKRLRSKLLKCNANISFNKHCLSRNITPKYANIKVPITSQAARITQTKVICTRIKKKKNKKHLVVFDCIIIVILITQHNEWKPKLNKFRAFYETPF
jgi:hypothetical protein